MLSFFLWLTYRLIEEERVRSKQYEQERNIHMYEWNSKKHQTILKSYGNKNYFENMHEIYNFLKCKIAKQFKYK